MQRFCRVTADLLSLRASADVRRERKLRTMDPLKHAVVPRAAANQISRRRHSMQRRRKRVGVSDLTLISKVTNEAINDNLKIRFENAEIYVCAWDALANLEAVRLLTLALDVHRPCACLC